MIGLVERVFPFLSTSRLNAASLRVPGSAGLPAQDWETKAGSVLPHADPASFSQVMTRTQADISAAEHERLCAKASNLAGADGVTVARAHVYNACHARLAAELAVARG